MVGQYIQKKEEEKQIEEEQAAKTRYWNITVCYDDDDDEDCTIAITHKEPDNSLSMEDEHLDTIPATESDEFIKSNVKNLVSNLSDSEDPHHFNAESDLIESSLNRDSPITSSSSKIDSLFDEFAGELTLLKSILPEINKTDCDLEEEIRLIKRLLYDNSTPRPPEEFISENSDTPIESFSLFSIPVEESESFMEEIDLSFTPDDPMPPGIEEDDYDSKMDILILEELLSNNSLSLPKNMSFHFDIPSSSRPSTNPPDGKLKTRWSGPFTIAKVFPYGTVELSQADRPNFKVNGHRIKHYFGGDVPQLVVPDLQTFPLDQLKYGGISIPENMKTLAKEFVLKSSYPLHNLGITYPNLID
uniref:Reverse transcriptase domain-containing protein n=1 Tax=Tanacetum cinerariifolium TaxID=118510 RepID=A0A6L2KTQ5_TANCI|nr:reverse transcriptase domain-containing protein [Tanacetum cinerariifolium]